MHDPAPLLTQARLLLDERLEPCIIRRRCRHVSTGEGDVAARRGVAWNVHDVVEERPRAPDAVRVRIAVDDVGVRRLRRALVEEREVYVVGEGEGWGHRDLMGRLEERRAERAGRQWAGVGGGGGVGTRRGGDTPAL